MNREERRKLSKGNKKIDGDLKYLNTPVTIAEAVQIARGVAEDVLADYQQRAKALQVATSIQVELIKEILISSGTITEADYREKYIQRVEEFNEMQKQALENEEESEDTEVEDNTPKVSAKVSDIEVQKV